GWKDPDDPGWRSGGHRYRVHDRGYDGGSSDDPAAGVYHEGHAGVGGRYGAGGPCRVRKTDAGTCGGKSAGHEVPALCPEGTADTGGRRPGEGGRQDQPDGPREGEGGIPRGYHRDG